MFREDKILKELMPLAELGGFIQECINPNYSENIKNETENKVSMDDDLLEPQNNNLKK